MTDDENDAPNWYDERAVDGFCPEDVEHPEDWYAQALKANVPIHWIMDWKQYGGEARCYNHAAFLRWFVEEDPYAN